MSHSIDKVRCPLCPQKEHYLVDHLADTHKLSLEEARQRYPELPLVSESLLQTYRREAVRRRTQPPLPIKFGPVTIPVNWDVPLQDCLPWPDSYRFPTRGELRPIVEDIAVALKARRTVFLWGLPGTGKDALVHAYSALTKSPAEVFPVRPDTNVQEWFYVRGFDRESTHWEEGRMLQICRDGFQTPSGRRVPYVVLITDFDRAGKVQAEGVRLLTDTIQGRIKGPHGTYPVLPGTQFIFTANTSGAGDSRGRYISANPIDGSIMTRIGRKFRFVWLDWADEGAILKAKFPSMTARYPELLPILADCTKALRGAIEAEEIFGDFSHRELCAWIEHAQDLLDTFPEMTLKDLLCRAARCWIDGMPDVETRLAAQRVIDPYTGVLDYLQEPGAETETLEQLLASEGG